MSARKSQLWKRLPFLILVGAGLLFWRAGYFPRDRTLVWDLPDDPSLRSVEVQLYQGTELLKREQFFFTRGPRAKVEEHVKLGRGDYQLRFFLAREGKPLETVTVPLHLGSEELVERRIR